MNNNCGDCGKFALSAIILTEKQVVRIAENLFSIIAEIRNPNVLNLLNNNCGKNLSPKGEKKTALKALSFFSFWNFGARKQTNKNEGHNMDCDKQIKRIIGNIESAVSILKENNFDLLDSVSWRLADAGLMLRELIETEGIEDVDGVHYPTGMKAILPVKQK